MTRAITKTALSLLGALCIIILVSSCATTPLTATSDEEQARSHLDLGKAYLQAGQHTSALKEFLAAEKLTPKDPETHFYMGVAYREVRLFEKAARAFEKAVKYKPSYSEAHNYLGTVYMMMGRYDDAIKEFTATLSDDLYETPVLALNNLGWAYYKKGNYTMALTTYKKALKKSPNTNILFLIQKHMGLAYLGINQIEEAIHYLERSLETAPYDPEAHYWLGMSYRENKEYKHAIDEFRETVKISRNSEYGQKAQEQLHSILGR